MIQLMPAAGEIFEDFCTQVAEKQLVVIEANFSDGFENLWVKLGWVILTALTHEIWNFQVISFVKSQIS